jgi:hypothetical protein
MAVAYGTSSSTAEATTANTVITAPASIADGDTLLIWHFIYNGSGAPPTCTPPAGFALAPGSWPINVVAGAQQADVHLWWKTAASESGSYTVTHTSAVCRGAMVRCTGADTTSPFAPNPTLNSGTLGTTTTALGLTTTIDNELILFLGQDWHDTSNSLTAPTGTTPTFTARVNDAAGQFIATGNLSPAGATGNKTQTNNSANDPFFGSLVALQPLTATPVTGFIPHRMPLGV